MSNPSEEYNFGPKATRILKYEGRSSRYFNIARKVALCSEESPFQHGAILVKGGSIINSSCNKQSFSSFGARFRTRQEGIDRSITEGATIYVCRVGKDNTYRLSKPCPMCHQAMLYVGIKRVYWTIDKDTCAMAKL
jgi:deoxycytidylate deaminase